MGWGIQMSKLRQLGVLNEEHMGLCVEVWLIGWMFFGAVMEVDENTSRNRMSRDYTYYSHLFTPLPPC